MTNICQAIEEELMFIQKQEDDNKNIYVQQESGMSGSLWKEMLTHPDAMRIEVSKEFTRTATDLLDSLYVKDPKTGKEVLPAGQHLYMVENPVIIYIPDYKLFRNWDHDGIFIAHWLEAQSELKGRIQYCWVQPKLQLNHWSSNPNNFPTPMSYNDITTDQYKSSFLLKSGQSKESLASLIDLYSHLHFAFASVIYMIRQPNLNYVTQTTVGSSNVRKRLEKKKGIPKERWSRIQWNVGEHVQREVRETMGEEHCTALHRVRGFYRKAKSHYNNVTKIDGKWFQWIEPFWRGHPAFGIVKSSYAPKIEEKT